MFCVKIIFKKIKIFLQNMVNILIIYILFLQYLRLYLFELSQNISMIDIEQLFLKLT